MLMCVLLRSIPMCLAKASLAFKAHWVSHSFKKRALWRTSPGLRGISGVFTTSGHATALPWAHGYARLLAYHLEGNKAAHASRRSVGNSLAWPHHKAGIWPFQLGSGQEVIS